MSEATNEALDRLIHEMMGECWHETKPRAICLCIAKAKGLEVKL